MRIAIDARELQGRATGVGTYLSAILEEWATLPAAAGHHFILCAPGPIDSSLVRSGRATNLTGGHRGGTWWEQRTLPQLVRRADAAVLFSPAYTAPIFFSLATVVAIHDVSFAAHPEWFSWREGLRRRLIARSSARRAARVVTISEFSKREIATHLGVPSTAIEVVYPAAISRPARTGHANSARAAGHGLPTRDNVILYAGSLFNRRHIPELIAAFDRLAVTMPNATLEIVGDNRTYPHIDVERLVTAAPAGGRISVRSYVPESELDTLYRRARAFVFLSSYEGFGLTPLEALSAGVPIVVLDTPVAREVYGSAALYIARPEPPLIEAALARLLTDDAERMRILSAARDTLSRYSWRTSARRLLDILLSSSRCRDSQ